MSNNPLERLMCTMTADRASALEAVAEAARQHRKITLAFLRYFNPATDLSSARENQWWSVYDSADRLQHALDKLKDTPAEE